MCEGTRPQKRRSFAQSALETAGGGGRPSRCQSPRASRPLTNAAFRDIGPPNFLRCATIFGAAQYSVTHLLDSHAAGKLPTVSAARADECHPVCSMFARLSRYHLTASGTRRQRNRWSSGQNGIAKPYPAVGGRGTALLIRGFGVQVPGGAPVLTWAFSLLS